MSRRVGYAAASTALGAALIAAGCLLAGRSPALPYNIRELLGGREWLPAAIGVPVAAYWLFAGPAILAFWLGSGGRARALGLPMLVAVHGTVGWLILRAAVPLESLYDVVGTPVLHWPGELEMLARFAALSGGWTVVGTGAALLARLLLEPAGGARSALARWGPPAAVLLPVVHWAVVPRAATDNLTELMAGGGGPAASAFLAAALLSIGWAGSSLAALAAGRRRRVAAVAAIALSVPLAYGALWLGTEREVHKYGQVFSALQFLLSRNRDTLAGGGELFQRYVAAHAAAVLLVALTQHPVWLAAAGTTPDRRRPGSLAGGAQKPDQEQARS